MRIINLKMYSRFIYPRLIKDDERFALFHYTATGFETINRYLRNDWLAKEKETIEYIDSAIDKFDFDTSLRTFRTIYSSNKKTYQDILEMCKKGLLYDKAYTSTSLDDIFGKQNSGFVSPSIKIITYDIFIPSTRKQGVYLPFISFKKDENEFLLKRNSLIEVENYEETDNELNIKGRLLVK